MNQQNPMADDERSLLARIDERTLTMQQSIQEMKKGMVTQDQFAPLLSKVVLEDRFKPVERIAYGLVALILGVVIWAIVSGALKDEPPPPPTMEINP